MRPLLISFIALFPSVFSLQAQIITRFAGGGTTLGDNGPATAASLTNPNGGVFDKHGNYYFASINGHRIRKINSAGIITTIAGNGSLGYSGDNGIATAAKLNAPEGVAVDTLGNVYFADGGNSRVRRIDVVTGIITTVAGNGISGYNGDNMPATNSQLNDPLDVCLDKNGNLYIADYSNGRVRKVGTSGTISTYAGNGLGGYSGDGCKADTSKIGGVTGLCIDDQGSLYIASISNARVFKIFPSGIINTIAGTSTGYLFNGDNIAATSANIDPLKLAVDKYYNVYIAEDNNNNRVRIVQSGIIKTLAGNGLAGHSGEGGPATSARFDYPSGVAIDTCENIYIPDVGNSLIYIVTYPTCNYLSVPTYMNSEEITIYPNPAYNELIISAATKIDNVIITDIMGKTLLSKRCNREEVEIEIDIQRLLPGMYTISITNSEGLKFTTKKFFKQ